MKKLGILVLCLSLFTLLSAFTAKTIRTITTAVTSMKPLPIQEIKVKAPAIKVNIATNNHSDFLDALGHQESGNRYGVVNRFGYMGRYQFGKSTLKTLRIKVSKEAFLNSPDLQEFAMQQNLLYNKNKLKKYIEKFDGKEINGILITESGLLAAAHLGGPGSVKKWFRTGKVREDGNGVKITSYMIRFGGYNLNL